MKVRKGIESTDAAHSHWLRARTCRKTPPYKRSPRFLFFAGPKDKHPKSTNIIIFFFFLVGKGSQIFRSKPPFIFHVFVSNVSCYFDSISRSQRVKERAVEHVYAFIIMVLWCFRCMDCSVFLCSWLLIWGDPPGGPPSLFFPFFFLFLFPLSPFFSPFPLFFPFSPFFSFFPGR